MVDLVQPGGKFFNVMNLYMKSDFTYNFFGNKHVFTILVGLLSILISLWLILYALPGLFASFFNTILGNIILLVSVILVGTKDVKLAVGLLVLFIFLFKFSHYTKEGLGFSKSGIYPFLSK
jgi:hypothetical protein